MTYRPTPSGSGVNKIVSGVEQTPAASIVDADVSASANIAGSKLQAASGSNAGSLAAADYANIPRGTSSQLAAGNGSAVTVGAGLSLSGGTLNATGGGALGPWASSGLTGSANALAAFDSSGAAALVAEPLDKTNKVLGWVGGALAWVSVATGTLIPAVESFNQGLVIADSQFASVDAPALSTSFSGTIV